MGVARCRVGRIVTAALAMMCIAPQAQAACTDWNPLEASTAGRSRAVTAEDLIGLVNFGRPDAEPIGGPSPLAISPDGRRIAVILQRADLPTNSYCQAVIVVDLAGHAAPRVLDRGGDYLMTTVVFRAMAIPNGFPRLNTPAWSPDGQTIAYLRRDSNRTQLWRVAAAGGAAVPATHAPVDVETWCWRRDGKALVYATSPGQFAAASAIDAEGRAGWRYDARMAPNVGARPQPPAPFPRIVQTVDVPTGRISPATDTEARELALAGDEPLDLHQAGRTGDVVWAERNGPSPFAPSRIRAVDADGASHPCDSAGCHGRILGLWWDRAQAQVVIVKSEGWNDRFTALYRWVPGRQPRLVLRTDDVLAGCRPGVGAVVCTREGARQPPRLVSINLATGAARVIFDPNPRMRNVTLGSVERLEWRTDGGREVYGDLVLPSVAHRGRPLPTLVVQYTSRGFLRGGTGNEYPIHLLAARGFAVLSIQNPPQVAASFPHLTTFDEISVVNTREWAERRNVNSAIDQGLRLLVSRGIADPSRIGLTGLSDGASAVRFALSNSRRFAAASISSCCVDEMSDVLVGPAWADYSRRIGYPPAHPVDVDFWRPYSLAINASAMDTPLLMQLADSELLYGLHAFTALRAHNQPVDLYVFPNEFHIKWQPRHRLAVFERNLDWFSFWLQAGADTDPAKTVQYAAWRALRQARDEARRAADSGPAAASRP